MSEHKRPISSEEVISYICDKGETGGGWVDFSKFSKKELLSIKKIMEEKVLFDGFVETQQKSLMDGRFLTYEEVLGKTLVSVNQAIESK